MKRARQFTLCVVVGLLFAGCQTSIKDTEIGRETKSVQADRRGTVEEQIAYQKRQIRRYEAAMAREEQSRDRATRHGDILEARQAEARRARYERKIVRANQEIHRLETHQKLEMHPNE